MPRFINQMFIVLVLLLLGFGGLLTEKCVSINNQPCIVRPTLTDLNRDGFHYNSFIISLDRCDGSCSTVEDTFGTICVLNEIEEKNLKVFNMIKKIMNQEH